MSWDSDFYSACMANADFASGINSLAYEYNQKAVAPFATYSLINANSTNDLDGADRGGERLIQLSVWAKSPTQAKELAEYAALGAVAGLEVSNMYERSLGRDDEEEVFGYAFDFTAWFKNP